eukprot:CAMPEP_0205927668 /NCGR_PEP_ID=MMETSP1325-20131115/23083_1 /ASSEMBLY_ACC=CAM_ASM_000708 /TAXON_ID=236786 /ORGANISM="Florenciella sp., Strain RCC1007" /LENGTH=61 /DNA_ID=CAMNT_0053296581 /DNA_START=81 /DNA_END=262 /DNA_ORIENTATION=+
MEMTGMDEGTAAMYMEMSGGDVETAMQIFFSNMDGGGGDDGGGGGGGSSGDGLPAGPGFDA